MNVSESQNAELIDTCIAILRTYAEEELAELLEGYPNDKRSLELDWWDIYRHDQRLAEDLRNRPTDILAFFEEAVTQIELPVDLGLENVTVRVSNLPESDTYPVGAYRAQHLGQYLTVTGQVAQVTGVKFRPEILTFECQRCSTLNEIPQDGRKIQEPNECIGCERKGPFIVDRERSTFVDHQLARVQQPPEQAAAGRSAHVDVVLEDDIVETIQPGDRVDITGTLTLDESGEDIAMESYIDATATRTEETAFEEVAVDDHLDDIRALANGDRGDPYELLRESLAPKIHGYEDIKEAIVLQLFGGTRVEYPNGDVDRGDPHILMLGDPGTAKSSLMRAVEELAPRSAYASGKGASAAGLTAAVVSDDFGDEGFSLKAGALVLAHKGIACIDEIDKVDEETVSSLHDALESQRININKAGINASLPAQTAVLAGGNPKFGRFDQYKPVGEQFDIGPTLLSRFDLKFTLQDKPNRDRDTAIVDHMLESRAEANRWTHGDGDLEDSTIESPVDRDLFRAYIAYAKQHVHPRIDDDEARSKLRNGFVDLREFGYDEDSPIPVTYRNVEAAERLAEASARVELRDIVTVEDVERAHSLIFKSLQDIGIDKETGEFDADIVETGQSKNQRDRVKLLQDLIFELQDEYEDGAPIEVLRERAEEAGINTSKVDEGIEKFRRGGDIYEPKEGYIRWV